MSVDRRKVGAKSKRKGKVFEQLIVKEINQILNRADMAVRGWWQSSGGEIVPDIIIPGLWIQCGHGHRNGAGNGYKKHEQAIREAAGNVSIGGSYKIPIAITRVTSERTIFVTARMSDLISMRGHESNEMARVQVQMDLFDFCSFFLTPWLEPKLIKDQPRFSGGVDLDTIKTRMIEDTTKIAKEKYDADIPDSVVVAILENESKVDKW